MKIDYEHIDELLEKYYECETTLEEEKYLNDYFASDNVADNHKILIPQFIYIKNDESKLSDTFDAKIMELLNHQEKKPIRLSFFSGNYWKYSAAAVIVVGIGMAYFLSGNSIKVTGNSSMSEEDFAYNETMNALQIISDNLGSADDHFQTFELLNKGLGKINQINHFEKLKYLEKVIKKGE